MSLFSGLILFGSVISLMSLFYCWFIYTLLIINLSKKQENIKFYQPISIIIPCYNEPYNLLKRCVNSCIEVNGEHEVILVNNNSTEESCLKAIDEFKKNPNVRIFNEVRQGKRFAHSKGLSKAKYDLVLFVDSDTIISKNSLIELSKAFWDKEVGAVTGQIRLSNKKENLITRSLDAMFWTSCNIFRRATTSANFMQVIPGAMGCYRKEYLLKLEKEYLNQTFLGRPCSISDDRWMTIESKQDLEKR